MWEGLPALTHQPDKPVSAPALIFAPEHHTPARLIEKIRSRRLTPPGYKYYREGLCGRSGTCTPVEVTLDDPDHMRRWSTSSSARRAGKADRQRLERVGVIEHFSPDTDLHTPRHAYCGDCLYLLPRPALYHLCRHPGHLRSHHIGPRPSCYACWPDSARLRRHAWRNWVHCPAALAWPLSAPRQAGAERTQSGSPAITGNQP